MPTAWYTRWDLDPEASRFSRRQSKTRSFENMVMISFQLHRPECKIENLDKSGIQKKIDCFSVDGFCPHCNTVFEAMGCLHHFYLWQEVRPSLTEEDNQRGTVELKRETLMRWDNTTFKKKGLLK